MIDTHAHLQFRAFEGKVGKVIQSAREAGVEKIIVVGTNLETSRKAVELAKKHAGLYASVGIHPHHVFGIKNYESTMEELGKLVDNPKAVAIGETGLDRHIYENTKYKNYKITDEFINLQKTFFKEQIKLALRHKKPLIIHNRGAVPELLQILEDNWNPLLEHKTVFHCSESDHRLLDFAKTHNIFIGVDGDITYDKEKQEFMKQVPLELLVLETDSPYFVPEPLKSSLLRHPRLDRGSINNEPKNLKIIAEFIANLKITSLQDFKIQAFNNSLRLFNL